MKQYKALKCLLVLVPIAILFYILQDLTPFFRDDYTYRYSFATGERITSLIDIFPSLYNHYFSMNGRLVTHFFAQLFLLIPRPVFNVVNTLAFLSLGLLVYANAYGTLRKLELLPLSFVYFALFLVAPVFGQSFLWIVGSANYLWGIVCATAFFLPYRVALNSNELSCSNKPKSILAAIGMLLLGIIGGWSNENNSIALLVMVLMVCIYFVLSKKQIKLWMVTGLFGNIIGFVLMFFAPAQTDRLGDAGGFRNIFSLIFIKGLIANTFDIIHRFGLLFLIAGILLAVYISQNENKYIKKSVTAIKEAYINHFNPLLFFIAFLLSYYSLTVLPHISLRTLTAPLVWMIVVILLLYKDIEKPVIEAKSAKIIISLVLSVVTFSVYFSNYYQVKAIRIAYEERDALAKAQIEAGNTMLELPGISSETKYTPFIVEGGDITDDPEHWSNKQLAEYYGVESVIKTSK